MPHSESTTSRCSAHNTTIRLCQLFRRYARLCGHLLHKLRLTRLLRLLCRFPSLAKAVKFNLPAPGETLQELIHVPQDSSTAREVPNRSSPRARRQD